MADLATTRPDGNGPVSGRSSVDSVLPSVRIENFPAGAIALLADELRGFGASITFDEDGGGESGELQHFSGRLKWDYSDCVMFVTVVEHQRHFPVALLIGGIRQTCQEAAERFRKQNAGN